MKKITQKGSSALITTSVRGVRGGAGSEGNGGGLTRLSCLSWKDGSEAVIG